MPNTEPNSLPSIFDDWEDWRRTYATHVREFLESPRSVLSEAALEARLKGLGFVGANLSREIKYIKETRRVDTLMAFYQR